MTWMETSKSRVLQRCLTERAWGGKIWNRVAQRQLFLKILEQTVTNQRRTYTSYDVVAENHTVDKGEEHRGIHN